MNNHFVHPSSIIEEHVSIGQGSKIWHFCHIMDGVSMGSNCIIGQNCFIGRKVKLGNGLKVQNNVSLYSGVSIEDDVFIGPSVVFTNVNRPRAFIEQKDNFLETKIRKGASIGANATIVCGNHIGQYAFIGAATLVNQDIPDYAMVLGVPGKVVGYVSKAAQKLIFDDSGKAQCPVTQEWYELKEGQVRILE